MKYKQEQTLEQKLEEAVGNTCSNSTGPSGATTTGGGSGWPLSSLSAFELKAELFQDSY